jgi:two-component system, cell cycle sensor histidine kinase and response regulator CckA
VEEQLQEFNREFSARIGQGTVALTRANGDLANGKFPNQVANAQMADMGELAASIAHDFNNILSIVQAYAALIVSNPTKPKDVIEHAEVIKETVEKGVILARQLVALGRKTETERESANVNDLLHRMVKLLTPMFPTTIVIAEDLDACVPMIMIDSGSIHQAILNLCINARDAMPEGGKILLMTRLVPGALLRQRLVQAEAEHYVCISVADTGVGMQAEVRHRVFESYFTTKKSTRGSGLGLTIVYRIVAEHAGFIEATSEPGCGSTFHIYLPVP